MPLSVTFADNADGSGATATVAGSGGASVSVFVQLDPAGGWVEAGTRIGDGPLVVSCPPGVRWGFVRADEAITTPVMFATTIQATALATRCRDSVIAVVRSLPLTGLVSVAEKPYPDNANAQFPMIQVTTDGVRESLEPGLNNTNDVGYPVRVLICDQHHIRDKSKLRDRYEPWRDLIVTAFLHRRLPGVPESVQCFVEPLPILDPNLPAYQNVISGLIIRCLTRKTR